MDSGEAPQGSHQGKVWGTIGNWELNFNIYRLKSLAAASNHRSINLALETALEIPAHEFESNVAVIDKALDFMQDLKAFIRDPDKTRNRAKSSEENINKAVTDPRTNETATMDSLIEAILSYKDEYLEILIGIVRDEMIRFLDNDDRANTVFTDQRVRNYIINYLNNLNENKAQQRQSLKRLMTAELKQNAEYLNEINDFYDEKDDRKKIKVYVKYLKKTNPTFANTTKVVRKFIKDMIKRKHNSLNETMKARCVSFMRTIGDNIDIGEKFYRSDPFLMKRAVDASSSTETEVKNVRNAKNKYKTQKDIFSRYLVKSSVEETDLEEYLHDNDPIKDSIKSQNKTKEASSADNDDDLQGNNLNAEIDDVGDNQENELVFDHDFEIFVRGREPSMRKSNTQDRNEKEGGSEDKVVMNVKGNLKDGKILYNI